MSVIKVISAACVLVLLSGCEHERTTDIKPDKSYTLKPSAEVYVVRIFCGAGEIECSIKYLTKHGRVEYLPESQFFKAIQNK